MSGSDTTRAALVDQQKGSGQKNFKNIPKFQGNYAQFEREVRLWAHVTSLKKTELGSALALSLTGTARQVATGMTDNEIMAEDGLDKVLAKIKELFDKDTLDSRHQALRDIEACHRREGQNIVDYILEFELLYNKAKDVIGEEIYSAQMKGFKLIWNAKLDDMSEMVVRVGCTDWKYPNAVSVLKKAFGSSTATAIPGASGGSNTIVVKEEPVDTFYNREKFYKNRRYQQDRNQDKDAKNKKNWTGFKSKYSGCWLCGSKEHRKFECPKNKEKINYVCPEKANCVYYAINHALLDSGASRNVCGKEWFSHFKSSCEEQVGEPCDKNTSSFLFGNVSHQGKAVMLPLMLGNVKKDVMVYVVDCNVPLLLSNRTMKEMEMKVDFGGQTAEINGDTVDLIMTEQAHYLLPVLSEKVFYNQSLEKSSAMKICNTVECLF